MSIPQSPPSLPRLVITPSTPTFAEDDISILPTHNYPYSPTSHHHQSRPKSHRSHSLPTYSSQYLCPPPRLPPAKTGHRPLRNPLLSLALLLLGVALICSSVMVTGSQAEMLLEMEQAGLRRLGNVGRGMGAKLGLDLSGWEGQTRQGPQVYAEAERAVSAEAIWAEDREVEVGYFVEGEDTVAETVSIVEGLEGDGQALPSVGGDVFDYQW
ncbi:hypothetical protein IAT38_006807 [Cryptococcus sp. DSM 104549]